MNLRNNRPDICPYAKLYTNDKEGYRIYTCGKKSCGDQFDFEGLILCRREIKKAIKDKGGE